MKRRKNSNLHVVREPEDPTDKIIEEIMDELNSEDGVTEKEIQEELARRKRKKQKKIGIVIAVSDTSISSGSISGAAHLLIAIRG